jgi:hypothetical protein
MEAVHKVYLVFGFVAIAEEIFELGNEVVVQKQITNMPTPCVIKVVCKSKMSIMTTVRNFDFISDMFNIGLYVICA